MPECVMVVVRMRPFNSKEKAEKRGPCIDLDLKVSQVAITNPAKADAPPKSFTFDAVFDMDAIQKNFYEESCYQLIESVMVCHLFRWKHSRPTFRSICPSSRSPFPPLVRFPSPSLADNPTSCLILSRTASTGQFSPTGRLAVARRGRCRASRSRRSYAA
jgi:hypothetical protein